MYPTLLLLGLLVLMWGAAVWASFNDGTENEPHSKQDLDQMAA